MLLAVLPLLSHILQSIYCEQFMRLVDSFGIVY